jgi:hypothetical protein
MQRKMFDTPVLPRLETILAEIKSGDIVVPKFQRPFVWDDDRRLILLDSIVNGMPIGSLLVWRTSRRDLRTYEYVGGVRLTGPSKGAERVNYLLDGHQRISTLFGALYSGPRNPSSDDETRWPLYYELGSMDRPAFRVPPRRGAVPEHWLPLDILLDGDMLFDFTQRLRQEGRRDLAKEAESLANIFRDYIIPIVPLVTEELNIVTDAFVRINSLGKSMSEAHMLRALTHFDSVSTDEHFDSVRARLEPLGWGEIDDQVMVNILKAEFGLDAYASDVRGIYANLNRDRLPLEGLTNVLEKAVGVLAEIGVRGAGALPYAAQLVTLAAVIARFPGILGEPNSLARLRRWFWITTYSEHFSAITGRRMRDSIDALERELFFANSRLNVDLAPIKPLIEIQLRAVRTRAFLLFLAQLPRDPAARRRRQERLAIGEPAASPRLLLSALGGTPGNRVIADPVELRRLRADLQDSQTLLPEDCDEFGIPAESLAELPNEYAFFDARKNWLLDQERIFIESFGLTVSDSE